MLIIYTWVKCDYGGERDRGCQSARLLTTPCQTCAPRTAPSPFHIRDLTTVKRKSTSATAAVTYRRVRGRILVALVDVALELVDLIGDGRNFVAQ